MISNFKDLDGLFRDLDGTLNEKVHFYVIGGAAMLYRGLKAATKDIGVVVDSLEAFKATEKSLKKLKFELRILTTEYKRFDLSQIFVKEDCRIDLFQRSVCRGFSLSEKMKKRSEKIIRLNNLTVSLCSTTDIFMFKTLTERPGD